MAVMLRKSRSQDQENTNRQNFYGFKIKLQCAFWCFLKQLRLNSVLLSGHLISFNKKHRLKNAFTIYSKSSMQNFFYFCIFPLPYIEISEIGISFSVTDLVRTKLMHALPIFIFFLVYRFMEVSIIFNWHIQPNLILFPKTSVIFTSITGKVGKTPIENARYGRAPRFSKLPLITGSVELSCFVFHSRWEFQKFWKLYSNGIS